MGPLRIIDPHLKPVGIPPPSNLREAKISPWWSAYKAAAKVEFDGHIKAKTWELVERSKVPKGKNILRGKWVFDDKRDESGRIIKFKARFVAMGFTQKYGVDYQETFAGVMVGKSFRIMLVILNEDPTHELEHWDVKMAFTQATLEEDIYMFQPELFEDKPDKQVCKLRKSLYGLKQSAKNWGDLLRDMLKSSGFTPLFSDPCVHLSKVGEGWCVVSTHVDDIFILFNVSGKVLRDRLFKEVSSRVEVDNLGPVSWALKTNILRDRVNGVIKISQEGYINQLLQKYYLNDVPGTHTPGKFFNGSERYCWGSGGRDVEEKISRTNWITVVVDWYLKTGHILCRSPVFQDPEQTKRVVRELSGKNSRVLVVHETHRGGLQEEPSSPPPIRVCGCRICLGGSDIITNGIFLFIQRKFGVVELGEPDPNYDFEYRGRVSGTRPNLKGEFMAPTISGGTETLPTQWTYYCIRGQPVQYHYVKRPWCSPQEVQTLRY